MLAAVCWHHRYCYSRAIVINQCLRQSKLVLSHIVIYDIVVILVLYNRARMVVSQPMIRTYFEVTWQQEIVANIDVSRTQT